MRGQPPRLLVADLEALLASHEGAALDARPPLRTARHTPVPVPGMNARKPRCSRRPRSQSVAPLRASSEPPSPSTFARRAGLSQGSGPLIGRATELTALAATLRKGGPIAIWGGAGIGKTRLAFEAVARAQAALLGPGCALVRRPLRGANDRGRGAAARRAGATVGRDRRWARRPPRAAAVQGRPSDRGARSRGAARGADRAAATAVLRRRAGAHLDRDVARPAAGRERARARSVADGRCRAAR